MNHSNLSEEASPSSHRNWRTTFIGKSFKHKINKSSHKSHRSYQFLYKKKSANSVWLVVDLPLRKKKQFGWWKKNIKFMFQPTNQQWYPPAIHQFFVGARGLTVGAPGRLVSEDLHARLLTWHAPGQIEMKNKKGFTIWLFNIAMENDPFIDDFPSYKPPFILGIFHGYVSHNQMVMGINGKNAFKLLNNVFFVYGMSWDF